MALYCADGVVAHKPYFRMRSKHACERPRFLDGCALLLDVSRYRAHTSRGLTRAPPAVCAASEASRHLLSGAATPPLGGGEYPVRRKSRKNESQKALNSYHNLRLRAIALALFA